MRRPYALIHDALPDYSEEEIEAGIQAALVGQKRSVTLDAMIEAVAAYCQAQQQARVEAVIAQAQETARNMPTTSQWKAQEAADRLELRRIEREAACLLIARVESIVDRVIEEAPAHMALHGPSYARFYHMAQMLGIN